MAGEGRGLGVIAIRFLKVRQVKPAALALLAVQLLSLIWVGQGLRSGLGFPLDDSWIHQVVARNLAQYGSFGFTPGVNSSGSSSFLWTLILSVNYSLLRMEPVIYAFMVNGVMFIGFGQILMELALKDRWPHWQAWMFASLASVCGNFVWFAYTGMEPMAFCLLSVLAIFLWFDGDAKAFWAGAVAGLLLLVRPEAGGLSLLLPVLGKIARRSLKESAVFLGVSGAMALGYGCLNLKLLGTLLPTTLDGRRWLYGLGASVDFNRIHNLFDAWRDRICVYTLSSTDPRLWAIWCVLACAFAAGLYVRRDKRILTVFTWTAAHLAIYAAIFPADGHGGRYQPLIAAFILPSAAMGVQFALQYLVRFSTRRKPMLSSKLLTPVAVLAFLLFAIKGAETLGPWSRILADGVRHINGTHCKMGKWIRDNLPKQARVASFDIGAVGYYGGRAIIDLGGLVDKDYLPFLWSGRVVDYMESKEADYVVLPVGYDEYSPDWNLGMRLNILFNGSVSLEEIMEFKTPYDIWSVGAYSTGHASPRQILYKVTYN